MNATIIHLFSRAMSELSLRRGAASGSTLLPHSFMAKSWLAYVVLSLSNVLLNKLLRHRQNNHIRRAQDDRRQQRLGVWEERKHSGLEKLHKTLSDLDIPDMDLNTVDMHEWLDYAFSRI